jgi:hypothetical protein
MKRLHIILDMDGTLIDSDGINIYCRPRLKKFLNYCFNTFKSVSIWTAASQAWYNVVYNNCFKKILRKNKFNIVYTELDCTDKFKYSDEMFEYNSSNLKTIKSLKKLWRNKSTGMNRNNTLILDDTHETYQENYGNAIPIPTYNVKNPEYKNDNVLLRLMLWLPTLKNKQIRKVEKRGWYVQTG